MHKKHLNVIETIFKTHLKPALKIQLKYCLLFNFKCEIDGKYSGNKYI